MYIYIYIMYILDIDIASDIACDLAIDIDIDLEFIDIDCSLFACLLVVWVTTGPPITKNSLPHGVAPLIISLLLVALQTLWVAAILFFGTKDFKKCAPGLLYALGWFSSLAVCVVPGTKNGKNILMNRQIYPTGSLYSGQALTG